MKTKQATLKTFAQGLAAVAVLTVSGMAYAEELVLVIEGCADAQCAVETIDEEIRAEAEWSLEEQARKMEAEFAVQVLASAEPKARKSVDRITTGYSSNSSRFN